jgi:hypothetical protein
MSKITESEFWKYLQKLSLTQREYAFDNFTSKMEEKLGCKIIDKPYGELGRITNPVMPVQDNFRNICYLKEFVPVITE